MTHLDVRSAAAPSPRADGSRGLVRWVCTSNPFYVLSALLVWLGLSVSFGPQVYASQTWALLVGMSAYTLLLAVTACLLVRYVGVWDDVRTLLLLVVLMFLATSVMFDEIFARTPARGVACYLTGLLVAVFVSEGMLRGMRLSLPPPYRAPYYLILGLFFLYPIALTPLLADPGSESLSWAMFGFSPVAGIVFLTLLPAIRRGRDYVCNSGSPWSWAWYPWMIFGVLAFGVLGRAALLCWSMHHVESALVEPYIFAPYFLVPFLACVGVLLLEIGLVERQRGVLTIAMLVPALLVLLTLLGDRPEPAYARFLSQFVTRLGGSPLYLTLLLATACYLYAAARDVPAAMAGLTISLAGLTVVAPLTFSLDQLASPRPAPLLAVGLLQLTLGIRRQNALRCLVGVTCLGAVAMLWIPSAAPAMQPLVPRGPIVSHLALFTALVIGAAFNDVFGRILRTVAAVTALMASLVALSGVGPAESLSIIVRTLYPLAMAAILVSYGLFLRHRASLAGAALILVCWLAAAGWQGYRSAREVVAGLDYIVIGLVLFALAVLTSLAKGGVWADRLSSRRRKLPESPG